MSDEICRCSHTKSFHQYSLGMGPCDYDGKCVVGCQKFEPVGPDRHPKWQRVEPGTVIPAGQPYRVEWRRPEGKHGHDYPGGEAEFTTWLDMNHEDWFIDSSWKPPLVLPTEPTWGIVLSKNADRKDGHTFDLGRWAVYGDEEWSPLERTHRSQFDTPCDVLSRENIADFIELTPEQVQRIEAAR